MEKPMMVKDQLISATDVARNFAKVKEQTKIEPDLRDLRLILPEFESYNIYYVN